ncbi:MAG: tRNA (adenosine(37)-N6)-dimethylallyltransferase MiaA, partial [Gammaproteobacteria bacterium]|nr:tRNA (adenosine(37)-N6)-dimethylallyltransferase MiaA [Gammaproteobacteria bacterium]
RAGEADATMPIETLALIPSDRQQLADAIAQRFRAMVARGFIDEVERLRRRPGLSADSPSMRAVGYRQIWAHLDGRYDWPETEQRAIAATRQLAKRQLTWLRKDPTSERVEHDGPDLLEHAVRRIDAILG